MLGPGEYHDQQSEILIDFFVEFLLGILSHCYSILSTVFRHRKEKSPENLKILGAFAFGGVGRIELIA